MDCLRPAQEAGCGEGLGAGAAPLSSALASGREPWRAAH